MPTLDPTPLLRTAGVLVIGGGPAAIWAAITAAGDGSSVVLVDAARWFAPPRSARSWWTHELAPTSERRDAGAFRLVIASRSFR